MVGQSTGHLNLLFVPLPPLILLALYELIVRQQGSSLRWGVALGLLAAAQFLVSPEIFLSSAILAAVGALGVAIARPRLVRHHAAYAIRGLTGALLTCLPIIAYPALFNIFGPNGYVGSAHGSYPFPADVLGAVVPDVNQLVSTSSIASIGNRFVMGNVVENGSYLGIPLLVLLVGIVVRWWRVGWVRFATCMAVVAWIISLGPRLTVNTHTTSIPLPFALFEHMPILPSLEVTRFSLYVDLFVALLLAIGIDRWQARALQSFVHRPRPERRRIGLTGVVVAAAVVIVASLLPNWPHPEFPTAVPTFFSSPAARRIPPGSVVLAYPYPDNPTIQAMLWQASDSMAFRLVGGYAVVPDAHRQASLNPFPPGSDEVPAALVGDYLGVHPSDVIAGLPATPPTAAEVRSFLLANDVGTVIVQASGADPAAARRLFVRALGDPSTTTGGVDAWFDIGDSR